MKKIFTILAILISTANLSGQAPQRMSYQAVIRNASNNLVTNSPVRIRISILQGSASGTAVYVGLQTPVTNESGVINIQIGGGVVVSGSFSTIDWANGPYFIKTEIDPTGGINYTITATSQLLSVPYALYATSTDSIVGGNATHYIGEAFGGGIIFNIYKDFQGIQHGLIVSLKDISTGAPWGLSDTDVPNCESSWNGISNSTAIINTGALATDAAGLCDSLTSGGYTDWYLPSTQELTMIWNNLYIINKTLNSIAGTDEIGPALYWSSSEIDANSVWPFNFAYDPEIGFISKHNLLRVRAVRSF